VDQVRFSTPPMDRTSDSGFPTWLIICCIVIVCFFLIASSASSPFMMMPNFAAFLR
jgi:hypothetical protein